MTGLDRADGGDGNIWFTDPGDEQVGAIFPGEMVALIPALTTKNTAGPGEIARGPHGELWYTPELDRDQIGHLIRLGLDGSQIDYPLAHTSIGIQAPIGGLTTGPDGAIWFTEYTDDIIGRFVPP
jgi:virginiamycin B lyase